MKKYKVKVGKRFWILCAACIDPAEIQNAEEVDESTQCLMCLDTEEE